MTVCIISRTIIFVSSDCYIFFHISLLWYYRFVTSLVAGAVPYFSFAIYETWSNKLSLTVLKNDVAKVHPKKRRGDLTKFFLSSSYIPTGVSGRTEKALAKRNDCSLACFVYWRLADTLSIFPRLGKIEWAIPRMPKASPRFLSLV